MTSEGAAGVLWTRDGGEARLGGLQWEWREVDFAKGSHADVSLLNSTYQVPRVQSSHELADFILTTGL